MKRKLCTESETNVCIVKLTDYGATVTVDLMQCVFQTPLHLATLTRQTLALEQLLGNGADIATVDRHGDTVMHLAAQFGYEECLEVLLAFIDIEDETKAKTASVVEVRNFEGRFNRFYC